VIILGMFCEDAAFWIVDKLWFTDIGFCSIYNRDSLIVRSWSEEFLEGK
jgi:hypothetical protein